MKNHHKVALTWVALVMAITCLLLMPLSGQQKAVLVMVLTSVTVFGVLPRM